SSQWVTNADDADVQKMIAHVAGIHTRFSVQARADAFYDRTTGYLVVLGEQLIHRDELPLLGDHNVANALAASLAVMAADPSHRSASSVDAIRDALRTFSALEHRIEPVGEFGGVAWINDSKS